MPTYLGAPATPKSDIVGIVSLMVFFVALVICLQVTKGASDLVQFICTVVTLIPMGVGLHAQTGYWDKPKERSSMGSNNRNRKLKKAEGKRRKEQSEQQRQRNVFESKMGKSIQALVKEKLP